MIGFQKTTKEIGHVQILKDIIEKKTIIESMLTSTIKNFKVILKVLFMFTNIFKINILSDELV